MKRQVWLGAVLVVVLLAGLGAWGLLGAVEPERALKYTLYIGLNDKDTYQQEIPTETAEALVTEIALKYVDGFTMTRAKGVYTDELGVVTYENTLVCEFLYAGEEELARDHGRAVVRAQPELHSAGRQEVDASLLRTALGNAAAR